MKITKQRLKEIIKEEVAKTISERDTSQQALAQARKDIVSQVSPEEKEEVSKMTNMLISYSKKKNLTQGRVAQLLDLLKKEIFKQMKAPAAPDEEVPMREEELDEMSAMSTGAVATSPKKEPLEEEDGFYEPHI